MFPTINLGPIVISTFTLLLDIGIVCALAWLWVRAPAHEREPARWLDAGLWGTIGAVVGGRLGFGFANWAYFQNHIIEMFAFWEGGYAWQGALVGGLLALLIYSRVRKEPLLPILDELALPLILLSALSWAGCAAASCAAGQDVPPGTLPFAVNWPDLYGVILPRWPTQLIGLGLSLIALGYAASQHNTKHPAGFKFALALTLIAAIAFIVSTVRGDDVQLISGWRLDAVANAVMTVLGIIALTAAWAMESGSSTKTLTTENAGSAEKS
jgi:prolipoprotein diacylglyceryl transferase